MIDEYGIASASPAERLAAELSHLDLDDVSPRKALTWLWEQQQQLGDGV